MPSMSPGAALRQLQQARAGLKRAREVLRAARAEGDESPALQSALRFGWESLVQTHRLLAAIPLEAANEAVMTKQLSVQRYATALLVRLRRVVRNELGAMDEEEDFDEE